MRISLEQKQAIHQIVADLCGSTAQVRLFGSRLDDSAKGGDIDLLVELDEPVDSPADLAAKLSVKIMRLCHGRKVDVVIVAPNLPVLPIHKIAQQHGRLL